MIGNCSYQRNDKNEHSFIGSLLVRVKKVIGRLYGAVASYDETKLFRLSAAVEGKYKVDFESSVADNFDCNISSPNGLRQTHSLAMILTQKAGEDDDSKHGTFPRLKKSLVEELKGVPVVHYQGPKKPDMPSDDSNRFGASSFACSNSQETGRKYLLPINNCIMFCATSSGLIQRNISFGDLGCIYS